MDTSILPIIPVPQPDYLQVGLVWQGGNGVDDILRDQVDQDIIRGRLGRGHRHHALNSMNFHTRVVLDREA